MQTELQGQLERITFRNEENHYTVAKINVKGRKDLVTIVGSIVSASPGVILKLVGSWDRHPKFGEQFRFISCEVVAPATLQGIERYLGSGLIKGVGPALAKRLVDKFGAETLDIIESASERLKEVEGIGDRKLNMIRSAWQEQKDVRKVMLFLQGHGISTAYAVKIFRQYGRDSIDVVQEDPYRLASDIFGIGFKIADSIAAKLGVPKDSPRRAEAGMLYLLQQFAQNGHVYCPRDSLISECREILDIGAATVEGAVRAGIASGSIIEEGDAVYIAEYYNAEKGVAASLRELGKVQRRLLSIDRELALNMVQRDLGISLAPNQAKAITASLDAKVLVITGGPGTGKTTIIKAIIRLHEISSMRILLAAPTGRAAKKMAEATHREAKTIHRLLEFSPRNDAGFRRNGQNPLDADLIVIDEASMVDTLLMHSLLLAVPREATLILVGDVDQLPSVGAGNVLKDIIESGSVACVRLNEIFRQAQESQIIVSAHQINRGEFPALHTEKDGARDFYFIQMEEPEKVLEKIVELCSTKVPSRFGFDPLNDIQVITPMHRGVVGAANLNVELQKHLNRSKEELHRSSRLLKVGDKVMQIRNNYDKEVFNGDIGRISSINVEDHEVKVDFEGRTVPYDFSDLDEIMLAYAISVHKSQGSEYPVVIMPVLTQHYMLLQRNLLYTAVTRGKKLVIIIGTRKAVSIALRNNKPQERHTRLRQRLSGIIS